ncbi:hypothetical protein DM02DRAFT_562051 [Periconia macrospinosa]|uniref:Zn(2)-C6 fungal-type domain-containing protein n=1 Tax=Periconia macrospinosa TaxID=97972 RepID=A0A2V1DS43_9PLEO|nr:hypothetical protein DM02DRAFT_562051 [Periconia macrospinosa]
MPPPEFTLPTKACHNCRKRRWKCDRSLPVCHKCLSSGAECLGYGKLFVWNNGVASRGKMMGKSFEKQQAEETNAYPPSENNQLSRIVAQPEQLTYQSMGNVDQTNDEPEEIMEMVSRPLLDPLIKDLSPHARYYVHHFAANLCETLVSYDMPGQNPMREIIPAIKRHPSLLQIMLAASAFHIYNTTKEPLKQSRYQQLQKVNFAICNQASNKCTGPMKSYYRDALLAKQKALSLLAKSIASVDDSNIDMIMVVILFFINYDLIESGRDNWKVHMNGARKIVELLGTPPYLQRPMSRLRLHVLSDFVVFCVMGSTFTFSTMPNLIPDSINIEPILKYAETNNYLSCPAPLLRIMIQSFDLQDLRDPLPDKVADHVQLKVGQLLRATLAFDPEQWSIEFEPTSPFEDLEQRRRIASAHRAAVCIYLVRVLPCTNPLLDPLSGAALVSLTGLADEVVHHLSYFQPGDTLFKSISWALFLAGAESEDPVQRMWIMDRLDAFYNVMFWGYIGTVKKVLEMIWIEKDKAGVGAANCWFTEVKVLGHEILIA